MTVFQEMVVESNTTEPNQMILVKKNSEDKVFSDEIKIYAIFSNFKVTKIKHSTFLGTPGIFLILL